MFGEPVELDKGSPAVDSHPTPSPDEGERASGETLPLNWLSSPDTPARMLPHLDASLDPGPRAPIVTAGREQQGAPVAEQPRGAVASRAGGVSRAMNADGAVQHERTPLSHKLSSEVHCGEYAGSNASFLAGGDPAGIALELSGAAHGEALDSAEGRSKRPRRQAPRRGLEDGARLPTDTAVRGTESAAAGPSLGSACVSKDDLKRLQMVGQVERRFLAARSLRVDGGSTILFLVDQHAADERVRLERLQTATISGGDPLSGSVERRRIFPPSRAQLSQQEQLLLATFRARARAWGWEVQPSASADGEALLLSVPVVHGVEIGLRGLLEYLHELDATGGGSTQPPPAVARVLASKACRSAWMFGDALSYADGQALLDALAKCQLPFQCAHGRPTIVPMLDLHMRS
jgi:DNA mismatch repair ATPase MutL